MRRKGQQAENDKTERVTGLGRRTREETAKWNQMTALRFQTGGRHQTSPASLRGLYSKQQNNASVTVLKMAQQTLQLHNKARCRECLDIPDLSVHESVVTEVP